MDDGGVGMRIEIKMFSTYVFKKSLAYPVMNP